MEAEAVAPLASGLWFLLVRSKVGIQGIVVWSSISQGQPMVSIEPVVQSLWLEISRSPEGLQGVDVLELLGV